MKAGIIGCGFIGSELAELLDNEKSFDLIGVNDIDRNKAEELIKKIKNNRPKFMDISDIIKKSDLIIESASKNILEEILQNKSLDKKNKKLMVMSTGGLIKNLDLLNKIKNCEVILPSGAIAGLDAIKSAAGKIKSLTLTTTKPAKSLEGAPYVVDNKINLSGLKEKKIVFEGGLNGAINGFPQNINVAATLFLASRFKDIKIKIIADPGTKFNTHEIIATGDFGAITAKTQNLPGKNPKTSYLAVLSAIQSIKDIKNNIKAGN